MDFVDEQDIPGLKICQNRGEVAGAGDHRAGGRAEADSKLPRHDLGQGGFAETGGAVQQHVVQRFAAGFCRLDEDGEVLAGGLLAGEVGERLRAQRRLGGVLRLAGGGDFAVRVAHWDASGR